MKNENQSNASEFKALRQRQQEEEKEAENKKAGSTEPALK
mgnify:CR=1 FL=1